MNPRTPVLVGVGAVQQRLDDPTRALEPLELMISALERAGEDAGCPALLARAGAIAVPRGFWPYRDPARMIAERFGAPARTQVAEIGVLQTTPLGRAAEAIASGAADVVLVAGGEAKYRSLRAQITGVEATFAASGEGDADEVLRPGREIWSQIEEELELLMPVTQYALLETALRRAEGATVDQHRRALAELWAAFSRVAAGNPHAWTRTAVEAAEVYSTGGGNRMLAFPYAKRHNSQWNVDQAAGLIFCSAAAADAAGVPRSQWVFPLAVAESNHMLPLSERPELHRSLGFRLAGRRALDAARLTIDDVHHLELYSCFPVAVRIQARELEIGAGRPLTVTGGMAFAGGPLNNFVLQALVRLAEILRQEGGHAMLTAVSGMLTKQGVSLWSAAPPALAFTFADVSDEVERGTRALEVAADHDGTAEIATYTVQYDGDAPARAVALCDLPDGRRALATTSDAEIMAAMVAGEHCGRGARLGAGRRLASIL